MTKTKAYQAPKSKAPLEKTEIILPALKAEQLRIKVKYCGICHSDLSMLDNEWHMTKYPFIPGHEAVGEVIECGPQVKNVKVGDMVGVGWFSASCMSCDNCLAGQHNLCVNSEQTIVGRPGAFADEMVAHWSWAIPLPKNLNPAKAGPLFCGGITVFNPFVINDVKPTDRVGVIGIGGLGHLALKFAKAWGCEVTAFSSQLSKTEELKKMGAHNVVNSKDSQAMKKLQGHFDFILSTANADLDWDAYLALLAPKGKLHYVGVPNKPIPVQAFALISGQKSLSGSPLGSPATVKRMLEFCVRHGIEAQTEEFPFSRVNEALDHLREGKARYRVVLKNDF